MRSDDDLGFRWRTRKDGSVAITHHGREATILRGRAAATFAAEMAQADEAAAQQRMARVTGQYRHGNERAASQHPRRSG